MLERARFFCPPFYRHHIPYTPHLPALAWHEGEESNQALSWLHDRMPVILDAEGVGRWLDAALPFDVVAPLLRPYAGDLVWKRVTTAVNQLKNEVAKDRALRLTFRRGSLPLVGSRRGVQTNYIACLPCLFPVLSPRVTSAWRTGNPSITP